MFGLLVDLLLRQLGFRFAFECVAGLAINSICYGILTWSSPRLLVRPSFLILKNKRAQKYLSNATKISKKNKTYYFIMLCKRQIFFLLRQRTLIIICLKENFRINNY